MKHKEVARDGVTLPAASLNGELIWYMTIDNSDSLKPTTIGVTKNNVYPADGKGTKAKDVELGIYEGKLNWIKRLLEINHKANSGLVIFLCMVKQV